MKTKLLIILIISLTLFTVNRLLAQEPITDADISYHSYTILTDMEDALINSMAVTYHYEWLGDQSATSTVQMTARVR